MSPREARPVHRQGGKQNRILIYLPPEAKAALDSMAETAGLSRSATIAALICFDSATFALRKS